MHVHRVVTALADFIAKSGLGAGDRLPTEREIMEALGIGRFTAREAMRHLQALGVVETRKGSGSILMRVVSSSTIHMPLSFDAIYQRNALLQTPDVRRGLEVEASMLAALRADAGDIADMNAKLDGMERVHLEKGRACRENLAFHLSISDATHSPMFPQLLEQMREAFEHFFAKPFDRPDFARRSFPFHRQLFDAISAGNVVPRARKDPRHP